MGTWFTTHCVIYVFCFVGHPSHTGNTHISAISQWWIDDHHPMWVSNSWPWLVRVCLKNVSHPLRYCLMAKTLRYMLIIFRHPQVFFSIRKIIHNKSETTNFPNILEDKRRRCIGFSHPTSPTPKPEAISTCDPQPSLQLIRFSAPFHPLVDHWSLFAYIQLS